MAYIRVDLNGELTDGQVIAFKAPCDCTEIEGIRVYYLKNGEQLSKTFTMRDAHRNELTSVGNLFLSGVYVSAILNTTSNVAYLQNADTNAYLESKFENVQPKVVDNLTSTSTTLPLSAYQGKVLDEKISTLDASFSTAANSIGNAIAAKGVSVPTGTSLSEMASIITNSLYKPPTTQSGTAVHEGKIQGGSDGYITITFPTPFESIPTVSGSCRYKDNNGNLYASVYTPTFSQITEGGCVATIRAGSSSHHVTYIDWTAIV